MQTIRIPAYAPVALPIRPPPPPPRVVPPSPTRQALTIVGIVVGLSTSVVSSIAGAASVALQDRDLPALTAPAARPSTSSGTPGARVDVFVEHIGDDCASVALDASRRCEDVLCVSTTSTKLRACLDRPEEEARVCGEVPDPSNAIAAASWIDARCSSEEERDYGDCVRIMSIVHDRCAASAPASQTNAMDPRMGVVR